MSDVIGILENIGCNASLNTEVLKDSSILLRQANFNHDICSVLISDNAKEISLLAGAGTSACCYISITDVPDDFSVENKADIGPLTAVPEDSRCRQVA
ncbi:hypothetical protein [Thalassomonas actiniarum]|uniref:Uncharacterized protein n=1 Tax=Thalassomonas actiniarum TaxID=485447 RepID=A0AAE9YMQ2_9GAMM|nr:hypothetical protein [Thalassomonas actiniarum]WDD97019.1 hypothetical protein SG35_016840 [Thalassomonas actiniarum]